MKTKRILSVLFVLLVCFGISSAQLNKEKRQIDFKKTEVAGNQISWAKKIHDFGEIEFSKPAVANFELKNNGKSPVIITSVKSSCGCTVANYSRDPILPGKTAKLSAVYNAKTKGTFTKSVYVKTNVSNNTSVLKIKGQVK